MTKDKDKTERNRDFERHGVYTTRNNTRTSSSGTSSGGTNSSDNKFSFKNSLVITPNYEIEFNASGGIKYIRDHEDREFFTNDGIFAMTNNIQKMPVLLKRGINKQSVQKKLIVEEKYNYEEKYEIIKNIIIYYEENRIDFQIIFTKSELITKDITTEFSLDLSIPQIDDIVTYKKYDNKQEYKSLLSNFTNINDTNPPEINNLEYMVIGCGKPGSSCMTLYPDKRLLTAYKNNTLRFITPNVSHPQKNYINLKIYLENYRVT
jgi:hypothetical protein